MFGLNACDVEKNTCMRAVNRQPWFPRGGLVETAPHVSMHEPFVLLRMYFLVLFLVCFELCLIVCDYLTHIAVVSRVIRVQRRHIVQIRPMESVAWAHFE